MKTFIYKSKNLKRSLLVTYSTKGVVSLTVFPLNYSIALSKNIPCKKLVRSLDAYFIKGKDFKPFDSDLRGTELQIKVWKQLQKIPFAQTVSYSELARLVGSPKAVRAVATAVGKNPVSILIPCHRVIRLTGEIGKYSGGKGIKKKLLDYEKLHA